MLALVNGLPKGTRSPPLLGGTPQDRGARARSGRFGRARRSTHGAVRQDAHVEPQLHGALFDRDEPLDTLGWRVGHAAMLPRSLMARADKDLEVMAVIRSAV
jgi:hypothetical protein